MVRGFVTICVLIVVVWIAASSTGYGAVAGPVIVLIFLVGVIWIGAGAPRWSSTSGSGSLLAGRGRSGTGWSSDYSAVEVGAVVLAAVAASKLLIVVASPIGAAVAAICMGAVAGFSARGPRRSGARTEIAGLLLGTLGTVAAIWIAWRGTRCAEPLGESVRDGVIALVIVFAVAVPLVGAAVTLGARLTDSMLLSTTSGRLFGRAVSLPTVPLVVFGTVDIALFALRPVGLDIWGEAPMQSRVVALGLLAFVAFFAPRHRWVIWVLALAVVATEVALTWYDVRQAGRDLCVDEVVLVISAPLFFGAAVFFGPRR